MSATLYPNYFSPEISNLILSFLLVLLILWFLRILKNTCSLTELMIGFFNHMVFHVEDQSQEEIEEGLIKKMGLEEKIRERQQKQTKSFPTTYLEAPLKFHKNTLSVINEFPLLPARDQDEKELLRFGIESEEEIADDQIEIEKKNHREEVVKASFSSASSVRQRSLESAATRKIGLSVEFDSTVPCYIAVFWAVGSDLNRLFEQARATSQRSDELSSSADLEWIEDDSCPIVNHREQHGHRDYLFKTTPLQFEEGKRQKFMQSPESLFDPGELTTTALSHTTSLDLPKGGLAEAVHRIFSKNGTPTESNSSSSNNYDAVVLGWPIDSDQNMAVALAINLDRPFNPSSSSSLVDESGAVPLRNYAIDNSTQFMISDQGSTELQDIYGLDNDESEECVVCLTDEKDVIFLPCNHFVSCHKCYPRLERCPICRSKIRSLLLLREIQADLVDISVDVKL